jgi:PTH2 family peptidyl-tRNA hydrolase
MGFKQAVLVRKDVPMGKGKLAVQVAHASVSCVLTAIKRGGVWEEWVWKWYDEGQKKVVLKVYSEDELRKYYEIGILKKLPASFIEDAGRTQLEPGTPTTVGLGPAPEEMIDDIVGELHLY